MIIGRIQAAFDLGNFGWFDMVLLPLTTKTSPTEFKIRMKTRRSKAKSTE
jgi:hypothetical protein